MFNGKAVLIFLCIFFAGGVAGGFIGVRIGCSSVNKKHASITQDQKQPRRPVDEWSKRLQKDFVTKIGVTPGQQTQIDPLILNIGADLRQLREQFGYQASKVIDQFDSEIMALLTPEQQPKYQQMIKDRQEFFKKMEAHRAAFERQLKTGSLPPGEKPAATTPGEPAAEKLPSTAPAQTSAPAADPKTP